MPARAVTAGAIEGEEEVTMVEVETEVPGISDTLTLLPPAAAVVAVVLLPSLRGPGTGKLDPLAWSG